VNGRFSQLAISDELTGLYNRRGFLLLGCERMKLARYRNKNLLLLYASLDNLKQINKQFGHPEGDRVLLKTAEIFRNTFRTSDILGRFGGNEFTALVIEEFELATDSISRRLQDNMSELAAANTRYPLSFSVGMTRYVAGAPSSLKTLLAQAKQALAKEKQANASNGGSSTVMFPGSRRDFSKFGFRAPRNSISHRSHGKARNSSGGAL
jgi:diguanylate cyclase (GGDEF)-like protein